MKFFDTDLETFSCNLLLHKAERYVIIRNILKAIENLEELEKSSQFVKDSKLVTGCVLFVTF